jgi:hypothetical protein
MPRAAGTVGRAESLRHDHPRSRTRRYGEHGLAITQRRQTTVYHCNHIFLHLWCPHGAVDIRVRVLQSDAHALGIGQGCAATASCPRIRYRYCHSNSVRIASPLRADMIFGKDSGIVRAAAREGSDG